MSIREQRKKVQRTIIHMAADYPPDVAIPQLRLIAKTLAALIPNDDEDGDDSEDKPDKWHRVGTRWQRITN